MTTKEYEQTQQYTVNTNTILIQPQVDPHQCFVHEVDDVYVCHSTSYDIMNDSCITTRGTTLDGIRTAIKTIIENKHKPPIPIDIEKGIIFLPTMVTSKLECAWFSYNHTQSVDSHPEDPGKSIILFSNGLTYEVNASKKQVMNQIMMAGHVFGHFKKGDF